MVLEMRKLENFGLLFVLSFLAGKENNFELLGFPVLLFLPSLVDAVDRLMLKSNCRRVDSHASEKNQQRVDEGIFRLGKR